MLNDNHCENNNNKINNHLCFISPFLQTHKDCSMATEKSMLSRRILTHTLVSNTVGRTKNAPKIQFTYMWNFLGGASGKGPACQCRRHDRWGFDPWVRKIPWRRTWQPIPVFLPGKFHVRRSLADYSPQGHEELDTAEATQHACMYLEP